MSELSVGAVQDIYANVNVASSKPILQVIDIKQIQTSSGAPSSERFRVVLSDSKNYIQGMLATQQNDKLSSGAVKKFTIVRLEDCICNIVQGRRIVIVLNFEPVSHRDTAIGSPSPIDPTQAPAPDAGSNAGAPQQQPPVQQQPPPQQYQQQNQPPQHHTPSYTSQSTPSSYQQQPMSTPQYQQPSHQQPHQQQYQPPQQQQQQQYQPPPQQQFQPQQQYGQQQQQQQPQQQYQQPQRDPFGAQNRAPVARMDSSRGQVSTIASLQPFQGKMWTIHARIIAKGNMRTWKNAKGEGKLFSIDLLDESGEIRGAFFKETAEKFYGILEVDKVYYIHKGQVKPANKQYNPKAEYEIAFGDDTEFERDDNCQVNMPQMRYNFVKINQLEEIPANSIVDVIAIVKAMNEDTSVTTKAGQTISKRDITLLDDSQRAVNLTLWEQDLLRLPKEMTDLHPVVALKGVRVSDFGGKSLSTLGSTHMDINPDRPEAVELRNWFDRGGHGITAVSVSQVGEGGPRTSVRRKLEEVQLENLGMGDKPDYFEVRATCWFIKNENFFYPACPADGCQKKVVQQPTGGWRCEKCNQEFAAPEHRFILQMSACDYTGIQWLSGFNDVGKTLLGTSADEMAVFTSQGRQQEVDAIFRNAVMRDYLFTVRAKQETWQDEQRVKCTVLDAKPVDFVAETKGMLADIAISY